MSSAWQDAKGAPGRVMVVDDTVANRELLTQELEDEGFEVLACESGRACLDQVRAWAPDVILLDIQMPVMNGIQTCLELKKDPETKHIPVLFLTATRTDERSVVEALRAGGNDFLPKPYSPAILMARVSCQVTVARQHAQLRRMAMHDELTGLFSRRYLFDALRGAVKAAFRAGPSSLACLVVDVDHFKRINDRRGHLEGDRVLREVAEVLRESTRETDLVARFGGEEFVVVLPRTALAGAEAVGEKMRAAVEQRCEPVTISVGVACTEPLETDGVVSAEVANGLVEGLLRAADAAVYRAKEGGRNRVVAGAPVALPQR